MARSTCVESAFGGASWRGARTSSPRPGARARPPGREPGRRDPRSSPVRCASAVERTNKMGYTAVKFCLFFSGAQKACDQPRTTPTSSGGTEQVRNRAGAHGPVQPAPQTCASGRPQAGPAGRARGQVPAHPRRSSSPLPACCFPIFFFNFIFHLFHFDGSHPCV